MIARRARRVRGTLFGAYRDVQRMVRDERWKLIRYPKISRTQLFDLQRDPHEMHDRAGEKAQQRRIARLLSALERWQRDLGDKHPLQ